MLSGRGTYVTNKAAAAEYLPFVAAALASVVGVSFSLFDEFCMWVRTSEGHQVDEAVGSVIFFVFATALWAWRRSALISARLGQATALLEQESMLARRDLLTGLLNRRGFVEIVEPRRANDLLLIIDLDGFKMVNDRHGHVVGDQVLGEVARRMTELEARGLILASARIGGDEFACLAPACQVNAADVVASSLISPMNFDHRVVQISASVGAITIDALSTFDEHVRRADAAMYAVKRKRRAAPLQSGAGGMRGGEITVVAA